MVSHPTTNCLINTVKFHQLFNKCNSTNAVFPLVSDYNSFPSTYTVCKRVSAQILESEEMLETI